MKTTLMKSFQNKIVSGDSGDTFSLRRTVELSFVSEQTCRIGYLYIQYNLLMFSIDLVVVLFVVTIVRTRFV